MAASEDANVDRRSRKPIETPLTRAVAVAMGLLLLLAGLQIGMRFETMTNPAPRAIADAPPSQFAAETHELSQAESSVRSPAVVGGYFGPGVVPSALPTAEGLEGLSPGAEPSSELPDELAVAAARALKGSYSQPLDQAGPAPEREKDEGEALTASVQYGVPSLTYVVGSTVPLTITASRDCYLLLLRVDAAGRVELVAPTGFGQANLRAARFQSTVTLGGADGVEYVVLLAAREMIGATEAVELLSQANLSALPAKQRRALLDFAGKTALPASRPNRDDSDWTVAISSVRVTDPGGATRTAAAAVAAP